ncbi:MAG: hypothetical protein ABI383_10410, partial [Acidobacteriaceae bacterium]
MENHLAIAAMLLANLAGGGAALGAANHANCHNAKLEASEPAARIYAASPFVHGYRDGYQQGFHDADIDSQFAHPVIAVEKMEDYRKVRFKPEFGEKQSYVPGYRAGFAQGSEDMRTGRDFQLFSTLREAMAMWGTGSAVIRDQKRFDEGVKEGYKLRLSQEKCDKGGEGLEVSYCAGSSFGAKLARSERIGKLV